MEFLTPARHADDADERGKAEGVVRNHQAQGRAGQRQGNAAITISGSTSVRN